MAFIEPMHRNKPNITVSCVYYENIKLQNHAILHAHTFAHTHTYTYDNELNICHITEISLIIFNYMLHHIFIQHIHIYNIFNSYDP